jgi:hypothetical protein
MVEGLLTRVLIGATRLPARCARWHKRLSVVVKARCSQRHTEGILCTNFDWLSLSDTSENGIVEEMGPLESQILLQETLLQATLHGRMYG